MVTVLPRLEMVCPVQNFQKSALRRGVVAVVVVVGSANVSIAMVAPAGWRGGPHPAAEAATLSCEEKVRGTRAGGAIGDATSAPPLKLGDMMPPCCWQGGMALVSTSM